MEKITVKAYAKVNLYLDIVGKRETGYHDLDMVTCSVDLCDNITVQKRNDDLITVTMLNYEDIPNNTAYKTAEVLKQTYNLSGMDIFIKKNIPIGAGLGGSSADACGTAEAIRQLYELDTIDYSILQKIGTDIPCMLVGGLNRVQGIGEYVTPLPFREMYFVVLYPSTCVSTKKVYGNYHFGYNRSCSKPLIEALDCGDLCEAKNYLFNALYDSAIEINDNIEVLYTYAKEIDEHPVMTGSGSSVILMYENLGQAKEIFQNIDARVEKYLVKSVCRGTSVY